MFTTVCDKNYLIGLEVLLQSLIDNNPTINFPFIVLSHDLTEEDLTISKKIYNNLILKKFNKSKYEFHNNGFQAFGDYSKYEIFSLDLEKIIFLDCDTLILGNLDLLINNNDDISAARDLYIDQFNTGVVAVNKKYLNPKITQDLIDLTRIFGRTEHLDQDIINYYFKNEIKEISISYNFLKIYACDRTINDRIYRPELPNHIKILHYIVKKPWQNKPLSPIEAGTGWLDKYWFQYYAKILKYKT